MRALGWTRVPIAGFDFTPAIIDQVVEDAARRTADWLDLIKKCHKRD